MSTKTGRTRLFFSGEIPIENHMREHPQDFPNCGIMLTFFTLKQSKAARPSRRLEGIITNEPYKDGKKRKVKQ